MLHKCIILQRAGRASVNSWTISINHHYCHSTYKREHTTSVQVLLIDVCCTTTSHRRVGIATMIARHTDSHSSHSQPTAVIVLFGCIQCINCGTPAPGKEMVRGSSTIVSSKFQTGVSGWLHNLQQHPMTMMTIIVMMVGVGRWQRWDNIYGNKLHMYARSSTP